METQTKTNIVKNLQEKSILVSREFNTSTASAWRAFTESKNLDQWWGPAPWHAETKNMNFSVGGTWHYAMVGPEGEKHWGCMKYKAINPLRSFDIEDVFCDENGITNNELPASKGRISFSKTAGGILVEFKMIYPTENDLQKIVEMGFEEGISLCMDQLAQLFHKNKV